MKYFLTFDVGTTAMKCILFDNMLHEVIFVNKEYSINARNGGIAEVDSEIYFKTFYDCIKDILESGIDKEKIASITFTTQGETLIPVDVDGVAIHPAIVWLDTRAEDEAEIIRRSISEGNFYQRTGLFGIDGTLPAAKVLWLYKNEPELYEKIHKILLLEDYLIYKVTGKFVSEKSLQSSTGWYDIINDTLFDDVLKTCQLDKDMLPEILPCGAVVAPISQKIADECGLSERTVVVTGAMDQIASAIGIGNIKEGMCTETTGTALVVGVTVEEPVFDIKNPVTVYKHYDNKYIYMPYSNTAGMSLKWFRDKIMPYSLAEAERLGISSYDFIDNEAEGAPAGSNGVIMLPQLSENGAFLGITLATDTSDLARSVLEGVAFMLREIKESIENKNVEIKEIYSLGGGAYSKLWCQIKADVCQKNIICTDYAQTTALGAAILASVALGEYKNINEALENCKNNGRSIKPNVNNESIYDNIYSKYKKYLNVMKGIE